MDRAREIYERLRSGGIDAINSFIETRASEELFLEFKRSADDGKGKHLHNKDSEQLSRIVSGFGNSEGGVVVWGVDCSEDESGADLVKGIVPLADASRFLGDLLGRVGGCTVPLHSTVEAFAMSTSGVQGVVVCLVPKSDFLPLQAVPSRQYFIRVGSRFDRTPHAVLEGQFGKSPLTRVRIKYKVSLANPPPNGGLAFGMRIGVYNYGVTIARDLYASVRLRMPGAASRADFNKQNVVDWKTKTVDGKRIAAISHSGVRCVPLERFDVCNISMLLKPPFSSALEIQMLVGAEGGPPESTAMHRTKEQLTQVYEGVFQQMEAHGAGRAPVLDQAGMLLLGLGEHTNESGDE